MPYPHLHFPALTAQHLRDARLFANRRDLVASMRFLEGGVIAEIGVGTGDFSEWLLNEFEPRSFVALDIFTMHEYQTVWGIPTAVMFEGMTQLAFYRRRFAARGAQMVIATGMSQVTLAKFPDRSFDLIYVDGAHDYDGVKRDTDLATAKVKETGVLIYNDYIMYDHLTDAAYGVVPAVNELVAKQGWKVVGLALQHQMFCDIALRR